MSTRGAPAPAPLGFGGTDELCMRTKGSSFTAAVLGFERCQKRGRAEECGRLKRPGIEKHWIVLE